MKTEDTFARITTNVPNILRRLRRLRTVCKASSYSPATRTSRRRDASIGCPARRPPWWCAPHTVADVVATVNFARERHLELAVRSGGHSLAYYSIVDGGVVLDLSLMKTLDLDPATRIARLGAGLTWGEVAEALHPHGLGRLLRR